MSNICRIYPGHLNWGHLVEKVRRSPRATVSKGSSDQGFTMVEILIAVSIGIIVITSIVGLYTAIGASQRNIWYQDVATRAARSEIENARAKGISLLVLGDTDIKSRLPAELPSDATGTLNVGSVFAGQSYLVTVTIAWQGGAKKVVLTGVVGRQGLIP